MQKYSDEHMTSVLESNLQKIRKLRGVHYVDVGYKYVKGRRTKELAIRIHVNKKLPKEYLRSNAIPSVINGIKTDVIVSKIRKQSTWDEFFDPIIGGIPIQNAGSDEAGTLGSILYDSRGKLVGLSNYHVLFADDGRVGDKIVQPNSGVYNSADVIGKVIAGNPDIDCAIFELNGTRRSDHLVYDLCDKIIDAIQPSRDDRVVKSGAKTGITYGIIDGIPRDNKFTISFDRLKPNPAGELSDLGDSGSIWLLNNEELNFGVGLHYGGSNDGTRAYAYDLTAVLDELGIHF